MYFLLVSPPKTVPTNEYANVNIRIVTVMYILALHST